MHLHANAVLTVRQRQRLCDLVAAGVTVTAAALVVGCSRQTASKWVNRGRRGEALADRSSRPQRSPRRTPAAVEEAILRAREQLREGPHVIGWALGIAASTVHAVLRRHGRSRLVTRPAAEEVIRYEYAAAWRADPRRHQEAGPDPEAGPPRHRRPLAAGEREGRLAVPVRRDRRPLPARLRGRLPRRDQRQRDRVPRRARPLLRRPRDQRRAGADRQRQLLQTPLGRRLRRHGITVKKTRPYRPQTNGKAERFIRTLLERWAYAYTYANESERLAALAPALDFYNRFRPHRALGGLTPLQRVNNLPGTNT